MKQIIFDVETKRTFDQVGGHFPEKLGISFLGAIERDGFPEKGSVSEIYHEIFEADLEAFFPVLEAADVIIGYNSDGFDMLTLVPYYTGDVLKFPSLDLMARIKDSIGRRISLDAVAGETIGSKKIGHGLDAIKYFENKEFDKLAKYCMKDVEITRDLYDFGRQQGLIKYKNKWNNLLEAEVDFSFEVEKPSGEQMALW